MNMLEYTNNLSCNQCEFHHAKLTAQHKKEMLDRWCAGSLSDIIRFSFRLYFSSAMIFWCWCVSFFFFIISTWRSIDNNTINSIFGCSKKNLRLHLSAWWNRTGGGKELCHRAGCERGTEKMNKLEHVFHLFLPQFFFMYHESDRSLCALFGCLYWLGDVCMRGPQPFSEIKSQFW